MTVTDNKNAANGLGVFFKHLGKVVSRGASYLVKEGVQAGKKMGTNALEKLQEILRLLQTQFKIRGVRHLI